MSDNIDFSTGRAGFANDTGLNEWWGVPGAKLDPSDDLQTCLEKGGLAWEVEKAPVTYTTALGQVRDFENRVALYRNDNGNALGFVSKNRYNPHQPAEIVTVLRQAIGSRLRTIGSLEGGRSIFASASIDHDLIKAPDGSEILPFVVITTRFDGGGATVLFDSSIRPVCWNTLNAGLNAANADERDYRVNHSVPLDPVALARAYGLLGQVWQQKREDWNRLAGRRWTRNDAEAFFAALLGINLAEVGKKDAKGRPVVSTRAQNQLEALYAAYDGAPGASPGTAWGALQAVTYYVDHDREVRDAYGVGKDAARLASTLTGEGAKLKVAAEQRLLQLVAA